MKKVFISGSRKLLFLEEPIKRRLNNIISNGFSVIVGDANGIDKSVQSYLNEKGYRNVEVFCMDIGCRNNIGNWHKRIISAPGVLRFSFDYYSTKDKAMASEADYGLMIWDGNSRGTIRNLIDLVKKNLPSIVYVDSEKKTYEVRSFEDFKNLEHINPKTFQNI